MGEEIPECYIELVNNIFYTGEIQNTDGSDKLLNITSLQRPMIKDLLREQSNDAVVQEY